ncbi:hypothetical protein GEMRC1_000434 [Eukaryota sp. GEM-RC1]
MDGIFEFAFALKFELVVLKSYTDSYVLGCEKSGSYRRTSSSSSRTHCEDQFQYKTCGVFKSPVSASRIKKYLKISTGNLLDVCLRMKLLLKNISSEYEILMVKDVEVNLIISEDTRLILQQLLKKVPRLDDYPSNTTRENSRTKQIFMVYLGQSVVVVTFIT